MLAVCDAPPVVANGSKDSKGEVHVVGSPGITPQSGNSKGGIDALCWLNEHKWQEIPRDMQFKDLKDDNKHP